MFNLLRNDINWKGKFPFLVSELSVIKMSPYGWILKVLQIGNRHMLMGPHEDVVLCVGPPRSCCQQTTAHEDVVLCLGPPRSCSKLLSLKMWRCVLVLHGAAASKLGTTTFLKMNKKSKSCRNSCYTGQLSIGGQMPRIPPQRTYSASFGASITVSESSAVSW